MSLSNGGRVIFALCLATNAGKLKVGCREDEGRAGTLESAWDQGDV